MSAMTQTIPVDQIAGRARQRRFRPGHALAVVIAAPFAALGWLLGRGLVSIGWVFGRIWLTLAFLAEAVIFGFRQGVMLESGAEPETPPAPPRPSKL
jgi:hypothetical protein